MQKMIKNNEKVVLHFVKLTKIPIISNYISKLSNNKLKASG